MYFLRLIITAELGTVSLEAGTRGFFQGTFLKEEHLAVALSSRVGEGNPVYPAGSERLFSHWSWVHGSSTKSLVPWVAVKAGFAAALEAGRISRHDLADWLVDEQPLDLPYEGVSNLCCIQQLDSRHARVDLLYLYGDNIGIGKVQTVAPEPQLSTRIDGLAPTQALKTKRVAIVGVGSGGSMTAINLAAAGVGILHVFDKDVLSIDNVFRHACDLRHLGRAKVLALRDQIASHDLPSRVIAHEQDVVEDTGDLWAAMAEVDLVLCATDTIPSRRLVNYVAVRSGTPLVMAGTFESASIGEIIRVRPGESACYECTRLELSEAGVLQSLTDTEQSRIDVPYGRAAEPGQEAQAINQGSRADVAMVAALQSRVVISTLLSAEPTASASPLPTDYLTWGVRRTTDLAGPFNFELPFSTNWVHLERQDMCPVCRDFGRPVDQESDRTYEKIMASVREPSA